MHPTSIWRYINKGLLAILSLLVLATIASIIFLSYTLFRLDSLISRSGQNIGIASAVEDFYINVDDAESAVRGYVITGEDIYLSKYQRASSHIDQSFQRVQTNNYSGVFTEQIQNQKPLSDQKVAHMKQVVTARQTEGEESARQAIVNGQGSELMDKLRGEITVITRRSSKDLSNAQQQSQRNLKHALWVAGVMSTFILAICIALAWYFQRAILHERNLEGTKNEFLSLASHQLRTPATNVKQYIGLLLDGYLGDLTVKQMDALRIAYKNNESEIHIMNSLLDVAKLDLKRIQLHKQKVNIISIVLQVVRDHRVHATERGQTLTLKAPSQLSASVDREYFKGVIQNLLDNAVKYSPDNTRIMVKVRSSPDANYFEVIVRDQGLGIKKREIPRLFMKFSRLNNEYSANTEGSGLGLYWVKQIMSAYLGVCRILVVESGKFHKQSRYFPFFIPRP